MKTLTVKSRDGKDLVLNLHYKRKGLAITTEPGSTKEYRVTHIRSGYAFPAYMLFKKTDLYERIKASNANLKEIIQELRNCNFIDLTDIDIKDTSDYLKRELTDHNYQSVS